MDDACQSLILLRAISLSNILTPVGSRDVLIRSVSSRTSVKLQQHCNPAMAELIRAAHVVIIPSPGMGHLIPLAELAKLILRRSDGRIAVTFIVQMTRFFAVAEQTVIKSLPREINLITLPPASTDIIPDSAGALGAMFFTIGHNFPKIRSIINSLAGEPNPIVALVIDLLMVETIDLAHELGVAPYLMYTTNCLALSFSLHFPELEATYKGEYRDLQEPWRLPGCVPLHGKDFMDIVQLRDSLPHDEFLRYVKLFRKAKGIMVNSFEELEPGAVAAFKADSNLPPIYPVGPLLRTVRGDGGDNSNDYLQWLDEQPDGSVLYVSFGSGGALTRTQMVELAHGLNLSGQRFLWVIRNPKDVESTNSPLVFLPEGFTERIRDVGLLVPSWVQQEKVLSHPSIGGFLSHCGWNSVLESIINGVPLIAWPLEAEQLMNAVLLIEDVKVALRLRASDDELVRREEVSRVIKCVMQGDEGKQMSERACELSRLASHAQEYNGSSTRAIREITRQWESLKNAL